MTVKFQAFVISTGEFADTFIHDIPDGVDPFVFFADEYKGTGLDSNTFTHITRIKLHGAIGGFQN